MHTIDMALKNIEIVSTYFPECVIETTDVNGRCRKGIDFSLLQQTLSSEIIDSAQERYQFTWPNKRKALIAANTPSKMTLRPCRNETLITHQTYI